MLVHVRLAHQPVTTEGKAVIAGVNNDRAVELTCMFQGLDDAAALLVEVGDVCIVSRQFLPNVVFAAWFREDGRLVDCRQRAGIEGVLGPKVFRSWQRAA